MQAFKAEVPNVGGAAVQPFRTRDSAELVKAIAAVAPPVAPDVAAELIAIGFVHEDAAVRKKAMNVLTKHVPDLPKFKAAYKTLASADQSDVDKRVRDFEHPYQLDIARAMLFHREMAGGLLFERDAAVRGTLIDLAVERAKRDGEDKVELFQIYFEWTGSSGWSMDLNLRELPPTLFAELAARRANHPFTGVSFYGCDLTDLPAQLADASPWLKTLSLAYAKFEKFPAVLWELENLESLEIIGLDLTDIPDDITKLTSLRWLDIGNMKKMKEIPASVCKHDKIEYLRIGNGSIRKIPDAIGGMKSLREIELQSTQVSKLPPVMFDMPNLKKINVRWSKVDDETKAKLRQAGKEVEG